MLYFIELSAVITGAIYGVLLARQNQMDFIGVVTLALIVAFGGGTLRDLFLDRHPLFWIRESHFTIIVFGLAILVFLLPPIPEKAKSLLTIPDAFALGLFSVAGTTAALECQTPLFIAALFGVITGTFGGAIGDVVCNRIPGIFQPSTTLYATCSFIGSWVYIALVTYEPTSEFAAPIAITLTVVFRLLSVRYGWKLPVLAEQTTHAKK